MLNGNSTSSRRRGARARQAILSRLGKAFPTRDYCRALVIKDYSLPDFLVEFTAMAVKLLKSATVPYNNRILKKYSKIKGFIKDVEKEEEKISKAQLAEIEKNEDVKEFKTKLEEITEWLREQVNEEEE